MADNPPTPQSENPEGEEQENLQAEPEQEEKKRRQAFSEEVPETHQIGLTAQLLASLSLLGYQRFNVRRNALTAVTDPNLAENLMDLAHPEKCARIRTALKITGRELGKEGVEERGFVQARFLFWKSPELTANQQQRASCATDLAEGLHQRVNARENELKIQVYCNRYSLDPASLPQFKSNINDWLKKNPGRGLDDALIVEAARLRREQGSKLSKKEEKETRKELTGCREKAVEEFEKNGTIGRAKEVIEKQILNPNQPMPNRELIRNLETGIYTVPPVPPQTAPAPIPTTAPVQIPPTVPVGVSPVVDRAAPQIAFRPAGTPSGVSIPMPAGGITVPANFFSGFRERIHLPAGVSNFFGGVGNKLGSLFGGLGKRLGGALNKASLAMNAAKTALNTGLNALAPGLGAAADKINGVLMAITGVDVEGLVVKLVIVVIIGIPVALMFLPLLLNSSNALPYYGNENSRKVTLSNNNSLGWSGFEEKFLATSKLKTNDQKLKDVSWQQFTLVP